MSKLRSFNLSDKIGFKTEIVIRDREGHYIVINYILKIKAITKGAPNYIKQILTEIRR